jgi:two-component system, cell cycle response regulator
MEKEARLRSLFRIRRHRTSNVAARILLVDDNRANRDLMLYLLRAFGYECDAAANGAEAIAAACKQRYDLAVVDILMPEMDGYELARRLRSDAATMALPLVAVTALAMPGDHEHIIDAGFSGYISKPIDPERFVREIESYLGATAKANPYVHPQGPAEIAEHAGTGPIVLCVDDLQVNLDLVRAALTPLGYRVVETRSVAEALVLLERITPDAILCDLHMPDEGGFALIERLRADETWCSIPFIFISSTAWQTKDRRRGLELGARKFIVRPIDPQRLREEIDEVIRNGNGPHR